MPLRPFGVPLSAGLWRCVIATLLCLQSFVAQAVANVTFVNPAVAGAQYVNGVNITVKVTSASIVRVHLSADGYAFGSDLTAANGWTLFYTFSTLGNRNLVATGYDANGQVVSSTAMAIAVVDVYSSNPRPGAVVANGAPASVAAASSVASVQMFADSFLVASSSVRDARGMFTITPPLLNTLVRAR